MNIYDEFEINYQLWNQQTRIFSNLHSMMETEAGQKLLKMGKKIIPFIIEKQLNGPDLIMFVLDCLMEGDPLEKYFAPEDAGNIQALSMAWVKWYRNEYIIDELSNIFLQLDDLMHKNDFDQLDHILQEYCINYVEFGIGVMRYLAPIKNELSSWEYCKEILNKKVPSELLMMGL